MILHGTKNTLRKASYFYSQVSFKQTHPMNSLSPNYMKTTYGVSILLGFHQSTGRVTAARPGAGIY